MTEIAEDELKQNFIKKPTLSLLVLNRYLMLGANNIGCDTSFTNFSSSKISTLTESLNTRLWPNFITFLGATTVTETTTRPDFSNFKRIDTLSLSATCNQNISAIRKTY